MPIPIRVRHPRGVTTIEIDPETQTLHDLKVLIFSSTEIPPSEQDIKFGYPPKPLPETFGPLNTIPLSRGDQLIVISNPNLPAPPASQTRLAPTASSLEEAPSVKPLNQVLSAPSPISNNDDVPVEPSESIALPGRDAGFLQLRVVPDDNSCLFSAVGVVFEGGIEGGKGLRRVIADAIRSDPETYPDVVLGQPRADYIDKILKSDTWGGAIELSIFSKHYKTEISSFDVATGRCDRFGQDEYGSRCVLVYSGIHYDAITLSPLENAPPSFHTAVFPVTDTTIIPAAEKLVRQLKARHYYTDTATFDLRCGICGTGLKGEAGARDHATITGHVQFGEY